MGSDLYDDGLSPSDEQKIDRAVSSYIDRIDNISDQDIILKSIANEQAIFDELGPSIRQKKDKKKKLKSIYREEERIRMENIKKKVMDR